MNYSIKYMRVILRNDRYILVAFKLYRKKKWGKHLFYFHNHSAHFLWCFYTTRQCLPVKLKKLHFPLWLKYYKKVYILCSNTNFSGSHNKDRWFHVIGQNDMNSFLNKISYQSFETRKENNMKSVCNYYHM